MEVLAANSLLPITMESYRYAAYALLSRGGDAITIRDRFNGLPAPDSSPDHPGDGLGRQKAVIVCGDLNDEPRAATTQILQGPAGSEIGTAAFATQVRAMATGSGTWPQCSTSPPMAIRQRSHPCRGGSRAAIL